MPRFLPRLALATLTGGTLVAAILVGIVVHFRREERAEIHNEIIRRYAAVLYPVALQQVAETQAAISGNTNPAELLTPVLIKSAAQEGMLGVIVFDVEGTTIQAAPSTLLLPELPPADYPR